MEQHRCRKPKRISFTAAPRKGSYSRTDLLVVPVETPDAMCVYGTDVATEEVTRLGACVFDLKFSSVSNNMHLVLSLTKVPIVSLCTKGPPWVAPRKPPFGGLVLGGVS